MFHRALRKPDSRGRNGESQIFPSFTHWCFTNSDIAGKINSSSPLNFQIAISGYYPVAAQIISQKIRAIGVIRRPFSLFPQKTAKQQLINGRKHRRPANNSGGNLIRQCLRCGNLFFKRPGGIPGEHRYARKHNGLPLPAR